MRAKIYIRVSTTRGRKELISPAIQEQICRAKAEQEGLEVLEVVYDLDQTGRDFAKRKIENIIEEVRRGEYEVVLLWKWSRFGRNLRGSLNNLHYLEVAGGKALSSTEPGDSSTTMGRFSRNQMLSIAELQSDMIGDSWKETHAYRRSIGLPHSGNDRFGYQRVEKGYEPVPIIGDALAEVYERYVANETFRVVAMDMADAGIRASNGDVMSTSRWLNVMETGFAAGLIRYRKPGAQGRRFDVWEWYPGSHTALIEIDLWEDFQKKRMKSLGRAWPSAKAKYSMSGLLKCWKCLGIMTATKDYKKQVRFRCAAINTKECSGVSILLKVAEEHMIAWIELKAKKLETVDERARVLSVRERKIAEIDQLKAKVADIDKRLSRLLDLFEDGGLEKDEYTRRKSERETERSTAAQRLSELEPKQEVKKSPPPEFYRSLRDAWIVMSDDRKRDYLNQVVDHIVIHDRWYDGDRFEIVPRFAA
jgi:DNA invertase Pin-like site-specific DNA recombinase